MRNENGSLPTSATEDARSLARAENAIARCSPFEMVGAESHSGRQLDFPCSAAAAAHTNRIANDTPDPEVVPALS